MIKNRLGIVLNCTDKNSIFIFAGSQIKYFDLNVKKRQN